jgi:hypothetical protein
MNRISVAAALLTFAGAVLAQTIYKYERPDGSLVYSDEPIRGARLIERFPAGPAAPVATREQPAPPASDARQRADARADSSTSALDAADAEVRAAQKAVDDARERLQQGIEPQPGERAGNVDGKTSRLTEDYFARMKQLEQDLRAATERLDRAYQKRNQAK